MTKPLIPDAAKTIKVLRMLLGDAPIYLERMESSGPTCPVHAVFGPDQDEEAARFVDASNGPEARRNLYFVANSEFLAGTRRKENLSAVRVLQVDVDIKDFLDQADSWGQASDLALKRLADPKHRPKGVPEPSLLYSTGGGYQAMWRLVEPISVPEAEALIAALIGLLGGDEAVKDAIHLMRVPCTVNWLNEKKRESGRQPEVGLLLIGPANGKPIASYHASDFKISRPRSSAKKLIRPLLGPAPDVDIQPLPLPDDLGEILPESGEWRRAVVEGIVPEGKTYGSRSEFMLAAVVWMLAGGVLPGHALSILLDPDCRIGDHIRSRHGGLDYARRQVQQAITFLADSIADLPVISVKGGGLPHEVDKAEAALLAAGHGVYQRGESMVRVVRLPKSDGDDGVQRPSGALLIVAVSPPWLREKYALSARWVKEGQKGEVHINPPFEHAHALLARAGEWKAPILVGVVSCPTMRSDGTILQEPGYDAVSGLLYDPAGIEFPPVPDSPTQEQAKAALEVLYGPFREYQFPTRADRAVLLSACLTAVIRRNLPSAPLFAVDAPIAGSGKTLLCETVGIIAAGYKPTIISQGKTPEEDEKRLSSVLMAGDAVLVIDNCERPLGGDTLCSMLTQEIIASRVLGRSEVKRMPTNALVMATGNNLEVVGDLGRRTLVCRIDTGKERPDQEPHGFSPADMALQARPELVIAALTVLRAYVVAGRPNTMTAMGSFENWNIVREALVWLGEDDPTVTRERVIADDPKKGDLAELLDLWAEALGGRPVTLSEIAEEARLAGGPIADLHQALAGRTLKGVFNTRSVGRYLLRQKDRVVGGRVLRCDDDPSGVKRYRLEGPGQKVTADPPF